MRKHKVHECRETRRRGNKKTLRKLGGGKNKDDEGGRQGYEMDWMNEVILVRIKTSGLGLGK